MLVKDPESAVFEPRYMPNYRVTAIFGRNRIEVQDEKGNKSVRRAAHVKVCQPVDRVINQLPPQTVYEQYGRTSKDVPHIPLQLFEEQRQTTEEGEKDVNMLAMDDTPDESNSRTQRVTATEKLCDSEVFTLDSEEEVLVLVDTCNESRSREVYLQVKKARVEQCQMNVSVTNGVPAVIDICDASRSRSQATKLQQKPPTTDVSASLGKDDVDTSINSNDESNTRTYKSTLTVIGGNRQQIPEVVTKGTYTLTDTNDESRDRDNRWSMSTDQQPQQLVTSVGQDRNVEPTVVNMHDIDKCRATNKHEPSTQHSIQASNQWLFSAFSKFTSNVLGKSKNTPTGGIRGKYQY